MLEQKVGFLVEINVGNPENIGIESNEDIGKKDSLARALNKS